MSLEQALSDIRDYSKNESPAVIFLVGELGAGKTHFTNQFAQSIGVTKRLPSPTFTFLQEYACDWEGKKKIIHCDLYRIELEKAEKSLEQIGFWDYLDSRNILFIEWPERIGNLLNEISHKTLKITLEESGERKYELN